MYRIALVFLVACVSAPATQHPVGIHHLPRAELWYRAPDGTDTEAFRVKPIFEGVRIARDATYAPAAPRPLVILSHGNWGTPYSQGWLATRLVDAGYIVLSVDHPGTSAESRTAAGRLRLWERAAAVSHALDLVLADAAWGPRIDRDRIAFVGHSFGGWTGLALAGGIYHVERQREACRAARIKDVYCQGLEAPDARSVSLAGDGESHRDPRIRAFVLLAGGPYAGFEPDSLHGITAPIWIATAGHDEILAPSPIAELLASATETIYDAGHFAFVPTCNWLGRRLRGDDLCHDLGKTERGAVHDDVATRVLAFLNTNLTPAPATR